MVPTRPPPSEKSSPHRPPGHGGLGGKLKKHPGAPVLVRVDSLLVEMRVQKERTADDIFGEIGSWEGESEEELVAMRLRELM